MLQISDNNFYVIQSWMVRKLKLTGLDLLIFAIIYGYSQDGENEYFGSLTYLAEMTGCTKRGVIKSLTNLVDNGYILREESTFNNIKCVTYKTNMELCSQVVNSVHRGMNSVPNSGELSSPNNKYIYNKKQDIDINTREDDTEKAFNTFWEAYPRHTNTSKKETFKKFCKAIQKTDLQTMLNAIELQKQTKQWKDGYIPMPTTWLNQEKWEDDVDIPAEKPKRIYTDTEKAWLAADWLSRKLHSMYPTISELKPEILQVWASVFDRMENEDNHSAEEILALMKFAFQDDFWCTKITSPWELRKHYVKLLAQAKKERWL